MPTESVIGDRLLIGYYGGAEAKAIDNARYFNGDILDILIYNRALSYEERISVESWLADCYFGKH